MMKAAGPILLFIVYTVIIAVLWYDVGWRDGNRAVGTTTISWNDPPQEFVIPPGTGMEWVSAVPTRYKITCGR